MACGSRSKSTRLTDDVGRLLIIPATPELTRAALAGPRQLAEALSASVPSTWPPEYLDPPSLEYTLDRLAEGPEQAPWWLHFILLEAEDGGSTLIGSCGYKGPPSGDGTVEMGYGIVSDHRRKGHATQATRELVARAFAVPRVQRVIAETLPELTPSIGVLGKCGFRPIDGGSEPGVVRFELTRSEHTAAMEALFREAVASIDAGDVEALDRLVAAHPRLVQDRLESSAAWLRDKVGDALDGFFARPYLLWFVAEDPARNAQLPRNVAQVVRTVAGWLQHLRVDSRQAQLDSTLNLAVCSPVSRDDGRQLALIDELLAAGASMARRPGDIGGVPVQALICRNTKAAEHLVKQGAELTLPTAVCLSRWDDVARLGPPASAEERQVALALAALNGKARGLTVLIELGVDIDASSTGFYTHATPLHHAVCSGELEAVKILVEAGAALTPQDLVWHATPLGWAQYYGHADIEGYLRKIKPVSKRPAS